jgi:hypothetical protein
MESRLEEADLEFELGTCTSVSITCKGRWNKISSLLSKSTLFAFRGRSRIQIRTSPYSPLPVTRISTKNGM